MKEPVDHIERPSLPWRNDPPMTECGINRRSVKTLTREEFKKRLKEYGTQRTSLLTCMTCANTAERWTTWDEDPRQAISREIQWEGAGYYQHDNKRGTRLRDELRAIAVLIGNHSEEFENLRKGFSVAMDFNDAVAMNNERVN